MKNKKIRKIVNEAIGFIHLMSDNTVSEKEGKKVIKRLQKVKFCNLHFVNGSISPEIATQRVRQAVEYGKYKEWNSEVGEQKAQAIVDDFHNGLYGSREGFWVQVNEAMDLIESLYCR